MAPDQLIYLMIYSHYLIIEALWSLCNGYWTPSQAKESCLALKFILNGFMTHKRFNKRQEEVIYHQKTKSKNHLNEISILILIPM